MRGDHILSSAGVGRQRAHNGPREIRARRRTLALFEGPRWLWIQRLLRGVTLSLSAAGVLFTSIGLITAPELRASPTEIGLMLTMPRAGRFGVALIGSCYFGTVDRGQEADLLGEDVVREDAPGHDGLHDDAISPTISTRLFSGRRSPRTAIFRSIPTHGSNLSDYVSTASSGRI
ncbi:hypothetical protein [Kribbella sp. VKM Ac-2566]|uniref:hypothetical protein n=1 Tax=Kribbella sp. VKM Ac-2566 TaxID=2512218 RepID=UPI0010626C73|nr:hypothetical protein [Kribbella sp. VKM Ac-2566]